MAEVAKKAYGFKDFVRLQELLDRGTEGIVLERKVIEANAALAVLEAEQKHELDELLSRHRQERQARIRDFHFT